MADQFGKFVKGINLGHEGDGVDRIHFGTVPMVSMLFSAFLLLIKYADLRPINCWFPFALGVNEDWAHYATFYCYVSNTFLPTHNDAFAPTTIEELNDGPIKEVQYYQWVPFIYIVVAIIFYLPRLMWQGILEAEGVNITSMVKTVNGFESAMNPAKRDTSVKALAKYMRLHFNAKSNKHSAESGVLSRITSVICCCFSRSSNNYVGRMYLLLKLVELGVVFGVFGVLNVWLSGYHLYGFEVIGGLLKGDYDQVTHFPMYAFCNLTKHEIASQNDHMYMCLLTMNLYNEKTFTLYWFFLAYVAVVTVLNAISWFRAILIPSGKAAYIRNLLKLSKKANFNPAKDKEAFNDFLNHFLRPDGVFIFQMINRNTTTVIMHELLGNLWLSFLEDRAERERAKFGGKLQFDEPADTKC